MRYADINVPHLIKSEAVCQKKTMTMEFQKKQWRCHCGIYAWAFTLTLGLKLIILLFHIIYRGLDTIYLSGGKNNCFVIIFFTQKRHCVLALYVFI